MEVSLCGVRLDSDSNPEIPGLSKKRFNDHCHVDPNTRLIYRLSPNKKFLIVCGFVPPITGTLVVPDSFPIDSQDIPIEVFGENCLMDSEISELVFGSTIRRVNNLAFAHCRQLETCDWEKLFSLWKWTSVQDAPFCGCEKLDLSKNPWAWGYSIPEWYRSKREAERKAEELERKARIKAERDAERSKKKREWKLDSTGEHWLLKTRSGWYQLFEDEEEGSPYALYYRRLDNDPNDAVRISHRLNINNREISVIGIADSAFENDETICAVIFPWNTVRIGRKAFKNCKQLATVIQNSYLYKLTSIGEEAFAGCTSLETEFVFTSKTEEIGENAFAGCPNLIIRILGTDHILMKWRKANWNPDHCPIRYKNQ